jgi:hypothetical protein
MSIDNSLEKSKNNSNIITNSSQPTDEATKDDLIQQALLGVKKDNNSFAIEGSIPSALKRGHEGNIHGGMTHSQ